MALSVPIDHDRIADFCRRNHIRALSLFGSVLRDDFDAESDVDVLVDFEPEHIPGFFDLARMQRELTDLVGRDVDLLTPGSLPESLRSRVMAEAQPIYVHR